jgi:hypothetical protein
MARNKNNKAAPKTEKVEPAERSDKKILAFVERCENPEDLESLIRNATKLGNKAVAEAAFRRRISLVPAESPGTVEHDFWQTVQAFEYSLSEERGKNTRLSRTRRKVAEVGVVQTLRDWTAGMPEFTGEAITLRHPEHFEPKTLEAARQRLTVAGVDLDRLT